ncbi:GNAT family N-acetyltransferase [Polaribacter pectinis]|uniref:GNAT family N-acetyltransferase n=1 Tax=Polaribacter pectinis TaxID=2738844 RepID=A0A7G9LCC0_9FLAO|nr:GNAT family N-acetyltransferase [Polaribacter pectinis]QNM86269.1 GNAT family N-acetyltransferase [Polaribacter pectinis]
MKVREANIEDWNKLYTFYKRIYRENHPLHQREFWLWQYGEKKHGRAFICLNDKDEVVGHVGANFGNNIAWIINVFLDVECRGKGVLRQLYDLARAYYPLAATAANEAGLGLYRNMGWIRYYDLVRYVKVNPNIKNITTENVCKPIEVDINSIVYNQGHYFNQPTLQGIKIENSTGISQPKVGGLRFVDLENVKLTEEKAWELGFLWVDYITSWNDLKVKELEKNNWTLDYKNVVPWRLDPIVENYFCDITFLSEKPLDNKFIVHRSYSDHGRVGSI